MRKLVLNTFLTLDGVMHKPPVAPSRTRPEASRMAGGRPTTGMTSCFSRAGKPEYGSFALEEPTAAELERRQRLARD
jgi:hypothetical protein